MLPVLYVLMVYCYLAKEEAQELKPVPREGVEAEVTKTDAPDLQHKEIHFGTETPMFQADLADHGEVETMVVAVEVQAKQAECQIHQNQAGLQTRLLGIQQTVEMEEKSVLQALIYIMVEEELEVVLEHNHHLVEVVEQVVGVRTAETAHLIQEAVLEVLLDHPGVVVEQVVLVL